jgi:hypothetical protein
MAKEADGNVTATDHRKRGGVVDDLAAEKRDGDCKCCIRCGECEAVESLGELRRQNSLVMRIDAKVTAMFEKALVPG